MQWREEGLAPQVAFEVLSPGNTRTEMIHKRQFYERYGVEEYYEYDPDRGTLKGWLRQDDRLEAIPRMEGWISPRLGVRFTMEGNDLVLYRPDGRRFETFLELERRAETERQRAETERQRGREEGLQDGLQQALDRLIASGMAEDQARRLLMLHPS